MRWLISSLAVLSFSAAARPILACPPTVRLLGDQALVAEVTTVLSTRGISTLEGECPALAVTLERRGRLTLVSAAPAADRVDAREVTDARTVATVIESWVRTDVEEPLLARQRADDRETPEGLEAAAPARARPGIQVITLAETGAASDHTTTLGALAGACSTIGRLCLGGRGRFATGTEGPVDWEARVNRKAVDALADLELPLRLGRLTLAPGLGLGLGWVSTHEANSVNLRQTVGARVETHLELSMPLTNGIALAAAISLELARPMFVDSDTHEQLLSDPGVLAHLGLGLRFGGT